MSKQLFLDDALIEFNGSTPMRRSAIAFCIFSNMSLQDVVKLNWGDEMIDLDWRALFILKDLPLSKQIDNVFWEQINGNDYELTSLPLMFSIHTGWASWEAFREVYKNCIPIDFTSSIPW